MAISEYVWKCLASGNDENDGGWNYDIDNVNYKFGYLSVVYFKFVNSTSGAFYHGCSTKMEYIQFRLQKLIFNSNPYFAQKI